MFSLFLPPEEISDVERKIRRVLNFIFRLIMASYFSYHCFDFLFSPLWMHGYVWSLNQDEDEDSAGRKGPGPMLSIHFAECSLLERSAFSVLIAAMSCVLFWMAGFRQKPRSVWYLLRLSALLGFVAGIVRCLQAKQRLYSVLHEGFYAYFLVFFNGVIMTMQLEDFWAYNKKVALAAKLGDDEVNRTGNDAESTVKPNKLHSE